MTTARERFGFLAGALVAVLVVGLLGIWLARPDPGPSPFARAGIPPSEADTVPALDANEERDEQTEGRHQLHRRRRRAHVPEQGPVEDDPDGRTHGQDGNEARRPRGPVVDAREVVEDGGRDVRLRAERKVEDPGRLVGQAEADSDERIGAAERDARKRETEELLHPVAAVPRSCLPPPPA